LEGTAASSVRGSSKYVATSATSKDSTYSGRGGIFPNVKEVQLVSHPNFINFFMTGSTYNSLQTYTHPPSETIVSNIRPQGKTNSQKGRLTSRINVSKKRQESTIVGGFSTHLKNIFGQIGNLPQFSG